nr:MAG TPA: hypothetical protein [Caudoviricetes sp.]
MVRDSTVLFFCEIRFRLMNILDGYLGTCFGYNVLSTLGNSFFAGSERPSLIIGTISCQFLDRGVVNDQNEMFYEILYMGFGNSV